MNTFVLFSENIMYFATFPLKVFCLHTVIHLISGSSILYSNLNHLILNQVDEYNSLWITSICSTLKQSLPFASATL